MADNAVRHFLPWVRQGAASGITTPDSLGSAQRADVSLPVSVQLTTFNVPARDVRLYGPADVTAIDPRQIVRVQPRHLTTNFESNFFPLVEFDRPDFPWLFTPAHANASGQLEALEAIAKAEADGCRKQLLVAATGLGKTVIFAHLAEQRRGRTLVLAHREELVSQAAAKLAAQWPELGITPSCAQLLSEAKEPEVRSLVSTLPVTSWGVGIVKAEADDIQATVVVASIQTLARGKRRARLLETGTFDLLVVDEAHHARAQTYASTLEAFRAGEPDGPLLLGVTATPDRGDGKGLDDLFDRIVASYDLLWGIRAGYLCEVRGLRVAVEHLDLSKVRTRHGDFDQGQAGEALESAGGPEQIAKAWLTYAKGRQTLVFTPTVALAHQCVDAFQLQGVPSAAIDASTPLDIRRALLAAYSRGELAVLANCGVLTEGYDEPRTDCIVVARPTKSRALYAQMIGRGTRRHPDKTDLLVLDVVGVSRLHSLVTMPSLFGLDEVHADLMETGEGQLSDVMQSWDDEQVRLGRLRAEEADLFRQLASSALSIVWLPAESPIPGLRRYARPLGQGEPTVILAQVDQGDVWTSGLWKQDGTKLALAVRRSLPEAQGVAEDYIRNSSAPHLFLAAAPWRGKKPSPAQRALCKRLKVDIPKGATMGEVSDLISQKELKWRTGK
jgi:superfamily II DNA or RNA helicase